MHRRLLEAAKGISLPLTEEHVVCQWPFANILDPWLPENSYKSVSFLAKKMWTFRSRYQSAMPWLYFTHHGGDDVTAWPVSSLEARLQEFRTWSTEPGSPTQGWGGPMKCWWSQDWDWLPLCPYHGSPSGVSGGVWDGSHCSWGRNMTSSHFLRERHRYLGKDLASSPGRRKLEKNAFSLHLVRS